MLRLVVVLRLTDQKDRFNMKNAVTHQARPFRHGSIKVGVLVERLNLRSTRPTSLARHSAETSSVVGCDYVVCIPQYLEPADDRLRIGMSVVLL